MKISKCPKCRKEHGFLAFRTVQRGNKKYPYVCHYDKKKYQLQMKDYLSGRQKSKPNGRTCCAIRIDQAEDLDFVEDWYNEYLKTIKRIHTKYYRFGFMNQKKLRKFLEGTPYNFRIEKTRQAFVKDKHWEIDWRFCENLLKKAGYSLDPRRRIMKEIFFRFEIGHDKKGYKTEFLYAVFLD